jgi:hypothetical protein
MTTARFTAMHPTTAGAAREVLSATSIVDALLEASTPVRGSELRRYAARRVVVARGEESAAREGDIGWVMTREGLDVLAEEAAASERTKANDRPSAG